jgi:glucan phosphoethanolaminetransferase (alkaline phosphatase superfamily)
MSDTEKVVVDEQVTSEVAAADASEVAKPGFKARFKEWRRKQIVGLKRAPQRIALIFLTITAVYYLICLYTISKGTYPISNLEYIGLFVFINTLFSILSVVSFLNAFPKRKKPVLAMIIVVFAMIAVMIVCDVLFFVKVSNLIANSKKFTEKAIYSTRPITIVHIVFLVISAALLGLTPVIGKLINKIDTRVELESTSENMHGQIDIQED